MRTIPVRITIALLHVTILAVVASSCNDSSTSPLGTLVGSQTYTSIASGRDHTCAVATTGRVYCWGRGDTGAIGPAAPSALIPVLVDTAIKFGSVAAGGEHTCAITTEAVTMCWGRNTHSQLGNASGVNSAKPVRVLRSDALFAKAYAGSDHSCALDAVGNAFCWGWNFYGQLGNSSTIDQGIPIEVHGGLRFASMTTGTAHTCAVTSTGVAYCWGRGTEGQLGDGTSQQRLLPTPVAGGITFSNLSAGDSHTCGIASSGAVYCWGRGDLGQLGTGQTANSTRPVPVTTEVRFAIVSAGADHTCALAVGGAVHCWGYNNNGLLGNGTLSLLSLVPVPVQGSLQFKALNAGRLHTCALAVDGVVYCWGFGGFGQLGNGSTASEIAPARVIDPTETAKR